MDKTLINYLRTISVLWILYGIVSFFLEIDPLFLILTHVSFFVILTFLFIYLLNVNKNEHKKTLIELEAKQKLEWEEKMHEQRNPSKSDPPKEELFKRTYEVVKNMRRKEGDAIDNDLSKEIQTVVKVIDSLIEAEEKLKKIDDVKPASINTIETTQNQ